MEECLDLPLADSESVWQRDVPVTEEATPAWGEVFSALGEAEMRSYDDLPLVLRPFWSRMISIFYLFRLSNQSSNRAWKSAITTAGVPTCDDPIISKAAAMLELWKRSHDAFHAIGDGSIASGGAFEAADFVVLYYHSAFLLLHFPRSVVDHLILSVTAAAEAGETSAAAVGPLLQAWAASAHAPACAAHIERMAEFLRNTLEGGLGAQDALGTFYDRKITFLGILGWSVMHAGLVASVLQRFRADAVGRAMGEAFEV
ncbi:hypothetical protein HK405_013140, partial [Cladochytrium tenue]